MLQHTKYRQIQAIGAEGSEIGGKKNCLETTHLGMLSSSLASFSSADVGAAKKKKLAEGEEIFVCFRDAAPAPFSSSSFFFCLSVCVFVCGKVNPR